MLPFRRRLFPRKGDNASKKDDGKPQVRNFALEEPLIEASISRQSEARASVTALLPTQDSHDPAGPYLASTTTPTASVTVPKIPETSTLGLQVLYEPPQKREVDLIFVHGLGGTSRGTWTLAKDARTFWPLEFLPSEAVIKNARISTFGYEAKFQLGAGKSGMSILDFAKDLLFELRYAKDEKEPEPRELGMGERPIIFIVHSMGGLVVKEAYLHGQIDPTYKPIIQAVSAIVFLSTPHRGSNLAAALNRILDVTPTTSRKKFIAELSAGSATLEMLNEKFRHAAPELDIVSFYETRATTIFGRKQIMVLPKESSVLGYPAEESKPLVADHNSICKYGSRQDTSYVAVRNVLISLIEKAKKKASIVQARSVKAQMCALERILGIPDASERDLNFFRERRAQSTCSWILKDPTFNEWIRYESTPEPRILCLQGNAGSGKSVLSTYVIQHLIDQGRLCHFFFIRFLDEKKRTMCQVIRSLAFQLAQALPEYATWLHQRSNAGIDLNCSDARTAWGIFFHTSLTQEDIKWPLCWVIDGLDEAEDPEALAGILTELQRTELNLRVLITSRPTRDISLSFKRLSKIMKVDFVNIEGSQNDIRTYVRDNMDLAGDDAYQRDIETRILRQARGNFLWAHLTVQELNQCQTIQDVNRTLANHLPGMDSMYESMARSVPMQAKSDDPTLGERILQWATFAQRPLTVDEMVTALDNGGILDLQRTAKQLCGGFVVVDEANAVTIIHETAREYLTRNHRYENPIMLERGASHNIMFSRCISLFMDPLLKNQVTRNKAPALLRYASRAWFYHLTQASPLHKESLSVLIDFLEGQQVLLWIHTVAKERQLESFVAASLALESVVAQLRTSNEENSMICQCAATLCEKWALDLTKIGGRFGTVLLSTPEAIYKLIPPFCPENSILYRQYGQKEATTLRVSGLTGSTWNDCVARLPLESGSMPSIIQVTGNSIAILANKRNQGQIYVFSPTTYEEGRRIVHPERVHMIQTDSKGELVASYGWKTTKIWALSTGECLKTVQNPKLRPRPLTMLFIEPDNRLLMCGDDGHVRFTNIQDNEEEWQILTVIKDQDVNDTLTILNSPLCAALSPGGDMIAFGYRGHPVTAWNLATTELIRQCHIWAQDHGMSGREVRTLGEVTKLVWHPFTGELFGLQREGLLFKWDTSEDDASATIPAGADYLDVNMDGSLLVTGDATGMLKIFTSHDLTLIYQLASQNLMLNVAISADSMLLYDIRGSYATVWESCALALWREVRSRKGLLRAGRNDQGYPFNVGQKTVVNSAGADTVTALAAQRAGGLYAYGTGQGVIVLGEIGKGTVLEVQRSPSYMSIEHMCWSDDGQLLASTDLGREIIVRKVSKSATPEAQYDLSQMRRTKFAHNFSRINQLLFQTQSHRLLIASSTTLMIIDVEQGLCQTSSIPDELTTVRWVTHPTQTDYLLGFGTSCVFIFLWSSMQQVDVRTYVPPLLATQNSAPRPDAMETGIGLPQRKDLIRKVLLSPGTSNVILEVDFASVHNSRVTKQILFTIGEALPGRGQQGTRKAGHSSSAGNMDLTYKLMPSEIASRVRESLAILPSGKLLFLDTDKWMCTWRLPFTAPRNSDLRTASQKAASGMIDRRYVLPGDCIVGNDSALCTVTSNGTLLCPSNGVVVAVEYSRLF